ncbi:unannotated protein [freshwater metagenome]|uniref:Unannotated protein n=1 Tax=freshwater metagenome TaxID=449393 RepID=A0A6J7AQG3_9ZZZZ
MNSMSSLILRCDQRSRSSMSPGASLTNVLSWSASTDPMATPKPPSESTIVRNTAPVPMPRRMPRRSKAFTAGSIANDKNSEIRMMMKKERSECSTPRASHSTAKPIQNRTMPRGTHAGIRSAARSGAFGEFAAPSVGVVTSGTVASCRHEPGDSTGLLRFHGVAPWGWSPRGAPATLITLCARVPGYPRRFGLTDRQMLSGIAA